MFKHAHQPHDQTPEKKNIDTSETAAVVSSPKTSETAVPEKPLKDTSPAALRELLEKNLKWSQIIYEQNRRINSKLFWTAVASWMRLLVVIGVIIASVIVTLALLKQVNGSLGGFSTPSGSSGIAYSTSSIESMLQFLPLDAAQKEQLKSLLK
jgi:hypothetical protein